MTSIAEIFSGVLAGIFVSYNENLLEMTKIAIRLYSISYLISGFNIFASSFFTALNDGFVSAAISFLRTLVFQVATILIMPEIFKLNGVWLAIVVAEILSFFACLAFLIAKRRKYGYV